MAQMGRSCRAGSQSNGTSVITMAQSLDLQWKQG
jgi:hypothetical protein